MPLTKPETHPDNPTDGAIKEVDANNMRKKGKPERIRDGVKQEVQTLRKVVVDEYQNSYAVEFMAMFFGILYVIGLFGRHEPDDLWLPMYLFIVLVFLKYAKSR